MNIEKLNKKTSKKKKKKKKMSRNIDEKYYGLQTVETQEIQYLNTEFEDQRIQLFTEEADEKKIQQKQESNSSCKCLIF